MEKSICLTGQYNPLNGRKLVEHLIKTPGSSKGCCLEPWRMVYRAPQTWSIQYLLRWSSWKKGSKRLFRGFVGDNILPSYIHKPWTIRIPDLKKSGLNGTYPSFFFWGGAHLNRELCESDLVDYILPGNKKNVSDSATQTISTPPAKCLLI